MGSFLKKFITILLKIEHQSIHFFRVLLKGDSSLLHFLMRTYASQVVKWVTRWDNQADSGDTRLGGGWRNFHEATSKMGHTLQLYKSPGGDEIIFAMHQRRKQVIIIYLVRMLRGSFAPGYIPNSFKGTRTIFIAKV